MNSNYEIDKTFTYLFHISDIHIQNNVDRQTEFKSQFNKLFNTIKNHTPNTGPIARINLCFDPTRST